MYSIGEIPYAGLSNSETSEKVISGYRLPQSKLCSDEVYQIIMRCWEEKTKERPSIKEIFNDFEKFVNLLRFVHSRNSAESKDADAYGFSSVASLYYEVNKFDET